MRRLRISGQVKGGCIGCCAAALFMIGLTAQGHKISGTSPVATRASAGTRDALLHAHAAPLSVSKTSLPPSVIEHYKQFPLSFEPNEKQTNSADVKFLARGDGYILFLTGNDAVFSIRKSAHSSTVMHMSLLGANRNSSFSGMEQLTGKSNYIIGNKPELWHTNIPTYRKVAEQNVYPGVDLVYYGTQRQLEYDFVISPAASAKQIEIAFQGAKNIHKNANGDLILSAAGSNDVNLHKPIAYQEIGNDKVFVAANYILDKQNNVAFALGNYDHSRPLIVDPILAYSTYIGGTGIDTANAIALAPDGTAFIAGGTFSSDFPEAHSLQPDHGGPNDFAQDAFVTKFSADGSTVLYSTFLGGENQDTANGIAVDTFGNAYVTGTTSSTQYPVTPNSFGENCGADGKCGSSWNGEGLIVTNAFVTKLNIAGTALDYSGYLGYYEYVQGAAITVDANGNAYVTGQVGPNIPPTVTITPPKEPPPPFPEVNAIKTAFIDPVSGFDFGIAGASNAYLVEITSTGSSFAYASYLGGTGEDSGRGIAIDPSGNAYVTGLAYSTDFPTVGALQAANAGGGDAFLSKINPSRSGAASLVYSTLIGGPGLDQGNGVAVDTVGNAYVAGVTNSIKSSLGFVPPAGAFQSDCVLDTSSTCEGDAFVAKLNTTSTGVSSLSYFTYLGGTLADGANAIALDSTGNTYITGSTVSPNFPTFGAVFQPVFGGGNADAFVSKLNAAGSALLYSSYLGGTNTDVANGIAVDTGGSAYVTGQTCSVDFPLANPNQSNPGGNCDAFISKVSILTGIAVNPSGLTFPTLSVGATSLPETVTITNGDNAVTIASITVTGTNKKDFSSTNTCPIGTPMTVGGTCTISATFTPSAQGIRNASITINYTIPGTPGTQNVVLNLSASTYSVVLSTSSLTFGTVAVGATSAAQTVTVANGGSGVLTISGITASSGFGETNNCEVQLQPFDNCVINVTYSPSSMGTSIGSLAITDNAPGPQLVQLTGTGRTPSFTITSTASNPTVLAGQSSTYLLTITPDPGFSQPITLSCSGLPRGASCEASSNPVILNGPTQVGLLITTALRTTAPPTSQIKFGPGALGGFRHFGGWLISLIALLTLLTMVGFYRRPALTGFGLAAILFVVLVGCSGGGASGVAAGTPAGSYQITVMGTAGSISVPSTPPLILQVN